MTIGAPNSPARWLSENIDSIPTHHAYALMAMVDGSPVLVTSGTKSHCNATMTHAQQVVCELDKYRTAPTA